MAKFNRTSSNKPLLEEEATEKDSGKESRRSEKELRSTNAFWQMDQILNEMTESNKGGGRKPRPSIKALNNEQFFNHVITVWGLEETQLR